MSTRRSNKKSRKHLRKTRSRKQTGGKPTYSNLIDVIETGNSKRLEQLLSKGAAEYVNNDNGEYYGTPLVRASSLGNSAIDIQHLVNAGANVNATDGSGRTALIAAAGSDVDKNEERVKILLDNGADVNARDADGHTALNNAIDYTECKECVSMLLKAGANVNERDAYGNTPLMTATMKGKTDFVKILIDAGADVNADKNGETALSIANDLKTLSGPNQLKYPEIIKLIQIHNSKKDLSNLDIIQSAIKSGKTTMSKPAAKVLGWEPSQGPSPRKYLEFVGGKKGRKTHKNHRKKK